MSAGLRVCPFDEAPVPVDLWEAHEQWHVIELMTELTLLNGIDLSALDVDAFVYGGFIQPYEPGR